MEQSPSWETKHSLASQEIPRILWKKCITVFTNLTTYPYPEPDESSLRPILFLEDPF
jgi:hypothetical protein